MTGETNQMNTKLIVTRSTTKAALEQLSKGSYNPSVVVTGRAGCGKTKNMEKIAKYFGLKVVRDDFRGGEGGIPRLGVLALTSQLGGWNSFTENTGIAIVSYASLPWCVRGWQETIRTDISPYESTTVRTNLLTEEEEIIIKWPITFFRKMLGKNQKEEAYIGLGSYWKRKADLKAVETGLSLELVRISEIHRRRNPEAYYQHTSFIKG